MKPLAFRLRILRLSNNYSQAGLAYELERLGNLQVSQSTICRFECGRSIPDAQVLMHLARIFNCHINELLDPSDL